MYVSARLGLAFIPAREGMHTCMHVCASRYVYFFVTARVTMYTYEEGLKCGHAGMYMQVCACMRLRPYLRCADAGRRLADPKSCVVARRKLPENADSPPEAVLKPSEVVAKPPDPMDDLPDAAV